MYEFHGWCALRTSTSDRVESADPRRFGQIEIFVEQLSWANGFCEVRPFNGEYFLHFGGFQNRPRREEADLASLLSVIAREAPGSYGLLYLRDDEDHSPPGPGEWRVRVLARGRVEDRFDPFLSPSLPAIED